MSTPANFNGSDTTAVSPGAQESSEPSRDVSPRAKLPSTTNLLIACNVVIFWAMFANFIYITDHEAILNTRLAADFEPYLWLKWGSNYGPLTLTGQFWRLITVMFVHANFWHLAVNMLFLWRFGKPLDRLLARTQMLGLYLLTGVAGSLWSLYWHPLMGGAGASGAIYGLAGIWIALLAFAKLGLPRRTVVGILVWLFLSLPFGLLSGHASKHTDHVAHAGGIVSGFVIGIFFALTFQLTEAERAARQRTILRFAVVVLVFAFAAVAQLHRSAVLADLQDNPVPTTSMYDGSKSHEKIEIARVFLDLKGDPKLVHDFSSLLNIELKNAGIAVTGSEREADAVLHGEIHLQGANTGLDVRLFRIQLISQNTIEKINPCAGLARSRHVEMFSPSDDVLGVIRKKYPGARTVRFDPANDKIASIQFGPEHNRVDEDFLPDLQSKLKESGLTLVNSAFADITLRINVTAEKVSIQEDLIVYDLKVVAHNGIMLYSSNETSVQSAKLDQKVDACSDHLDNLEWLKDDDPLSQTARKLTKNLQKQDSAPDNK
jgi:membrane associated rhomboid family serine protease